MSDCPPGWPFIQQTVWFKLQKALPFQVPTEIKKTDNPFSQKRKHKVTSTAFKTRTIINRSQEGTTN